MFSISDFDIQHLDAAQKIDLITLLWDSLPDTTEAVPVPDWHRTELSERIAAADANPEASIPWEQVRNSLREKH